MRLLKQVTSFFVILSKLYQMSIKAIVFGATGLTGSQVVEQLLEREDVKVIAVVKAKNSECSSQTGADCN